MIPTAVLAAQYAGTLDLLDTTTISARAPQPAPIVMEGERLKKVVLAMDLSTTPVARLRIRGHRWTSSLSYVPTLAATDVELGFQPQLFQTGVVSTEWQDRYVSVSLAESASYGTAFAYQQLTGPTQTMLAGPVLPGQAPGPGVATPTSTPATTGAMGTMGTMGTMTAAGQAPTQQSAFVQFGSSSTNGAATVRTGDRTTISLFGGYRVAGGLNDIARALIPEQYGPSVGAAVSYAESKHDSFSASANASEFITAGACPPPQSGFCEEDVPLTQLLATARHDPSALVTLTFSAGAATTVVTTATARETLIVPAANADVSYRLPPHGMDNLALSLGLTPVVDILAGVASYRFRASVSLSHPISHTVTLSATGGVVKSIPFPVVFSVVPQSEAISSDPYPFTAFSGSLEARFRLRDERVLTAGTTAFAQDQTGYGTVVSTTTFARLGVTHEFDVGAAVLVMWPSGQSYATLLGPTSTTCVLTLTGRLETLRF